MNILLQGHPYLVAGHMAASLPGVAASVIEAEMVTAGGQSSAGYNILILLQTLIVIDVSMAVWWLSKRPQYVVPSGERREEAADITEGDEDMNVPNDDEVA